jgi:hypothetical protein
VGVAFTVRFRLRAGTHSSVAPGDAVAQEFTGEGIRMDGQTSAVTLAFPGTPSRASALGLPPLVRMGPCA